MTVESCSGNPAHEARTLTFATEFWIAMGKLLGQRWITKHGTMPSAEWQRLLAPFSAFDPEQSASQLVRRLQPNARGEVWPPEMADVIVMLHPRLEDHGLPSPERAYKAAAHQTWIHPAVYEAAFRVGVHELRNGEARRRDFDPVYAQVCEELMRDDMAKWQPRAKPEQRLTQQQKPWRPLSPDEAKARCNELRELLGKMPEPMKAAEPPAPLTHEEFLERQLDGIELQAAAARYRRGASC